MSVEIISDENINIGISQFPSQEQDTYWVLGNNVPVTVFQEISFLGRNISKDQTIDLLGGVLIRLPNGYKIAGLEELNKNSPIRIKSNAMYQYPPFRPIEEKGYYFLPEGGKYRIEKIIIPTFDQLLIPAELVCNAPEVNGWYQVQKSINGVICYLSRSRELLPIARTQGYPGYTATWNPDTKNSVLSILYLEKNLIYLDSTKRFLLVRDPNGRQVFTTSKSTQNVPITIQSLLCEPNPDGRLNKWYADWKNQSNTTPSSDLQDGLVWPFQTWQEAWTYVSGQQLPISLQIWTQNGYKWIVQGNKFLSFRYFTIADLNNIPLEFDLVKKGDNLWNLIVKRWGGDYGLIKCWNDSGACRWKQSPGGEILFGALSDLDRSLFPPANFIVDNKLDISNDYAISSGDGRYINVGGTWLTPDAGIQYNGIEFYTRDRKESKLYIISPLVTPLEQYQLSPWFEIMQSVGIPYPPLDPLKIAANKPDGPFICTSSEWDGININCQGEQIRYTLQTGKSQCNSLDDFQNDSHCQLWAENYKEDSNLYDTNIGIESKLLTLCENTGKGQYDSVCDCYRPNSFYEDQIKKRYDEDPELSRRILSTMSAGNDRRCLTNDCFLGKNFSSNLYYKKNPSTGTGKTCSPCFQTATTNITAGGNINIQGGINIQQVCTASDRSYTWQGLIDELSASLATTIFIDNGVLKTTGKYRHVIVDTRNNTIRLVFPTKESEQANLKNYEYLQSIPTRDRLGNIIIDQAEWNKNPTRASQNIWTFWSAFKE